MTLLAGKVALVTGASKGIGAAIAQALAGSGAAVAVNYAQDRSGADATVAAIESIGGRAIAIQGDVCNETDAVHIVDETLAAFQAVDILVNNAAFFNFRPLDAITLDDFHRHFDTNVLGAILMTRACAKVFGPGCSVINVGSASVLTPSPNATLYCASKAALDMVTQVLSKELGARQIRVNSLWPGVTNTEGSRKLGAMNEQTIKLVAEKTALGRVGLPSDIAPAAVFLASDQARWVTGTVLNVSGGFR